MCRSSWNLGISNSWNPQGLSKTVMRLLYLLTTRVPLNVFSWNLKIQIFINLKIFFFMNLKIFMKFNNLKTRVPLNVFSWNWYWEHLLTFMRHNSSFVTKITDIFETKPHRLSCLYFDRHLLNVYRKETVSRRKSGFAFASHGFCFDLIEIESCHLYFSKDRCIFYLSLNREARLHR